LLSDKLADGVKFRLRPNTWGDDSANGNRTINRAEIRNPFRVVLNKFNIERIQIWHNLL